MGSGLFISFEGTEGGGKSTQIALLAERLRFSGRTVLVTREPGGTPLGEEVRHTLKHSPAGKGMCAEAELLLFNACRAQLVREVIAPALQRGEMVLSDRFFDSTFAYQSSGRGLPSEAVKAIVEFAVGPVRPDRTFLLRVPLQISEQRRRSRTAQGGASTDRFEESDRSFFERVEHGFDALAAQDPGRIIIVDATHSIDEVHHEIWKNVASLLGLASGSEPSTRRS